MAQPTLSESAIYSTCLEAILYGLSVLMYVFTMWILLQNRRRRQLSSGMLYIATALLILSTAEMAINIVRLREGFMTIGPTLPGGSEQYYADISQVTFVVKGVFFNLQTLILDGVVIWRAYVVWQKWYMIVVPALGWLGLLAASIGANVKDATASQHAGNIFFSDTGRWITAYYSVTLATNLTATGLLAFRIWQVKRRSARLLNDNSLSPILAVVIESGAIYSATVTVALITFVTQSPGVYVLLDMISPIISIVFHMITVRVGLAQESRNSGGSIPATGNSNSDRRPPIPINRGRDPYARSLAVEITQYIESDEAAYQREEIDLKPQAMSGGAESDRDYK